MKENDVRICEKYALTVAEAAVYFGIGEKKLRKIVGEKLDSGFAIHNGIKRLIKRKRFEKFPEELLRCS